MLIAGKRREEETQAQTLEGRIKSTSFGVRQAWSKFQLCHLLAALTSLNLSFLIYKRKLKIVCSS